MVRREIDDFDASDCRAGCKFVDAAIVFPIRIVQARRRAAVDAVRRDTQQEKARQYRDDLSDLRDVGDFAQRLF